MKASDLSDSFKAVCKILLCSRPVARPGHYGEGNTAIVLANGPSLNGTIEQFGEKLKTLPTIAVNFMANTPYFRQLKPCYYVLADPVLFGQEMDNVKNLWKNLSEVDWDMTLCVPRKQLKLARKLLGNSSIKVSAYNFVGIEGFAWLEDFTFSHRLASPRPRNVLIPALMTAINAGYKEIYITGADHSWMETLRVSDDNIVITVQPHFYSDSKQELSRVSTFYKNIRLHEIIHSFYITFRSYHRLQRFAVKKGIKIYNSTPGSYIDAFERRSL